jgi:hypothetical protein
MPSGHMRGWLCGFWWLWTSKQGLLSLDDVGKDSFYFDATLRHC